MAIGADSELNGQGAVVDDEALQPLLPSMEELVEDVERLMTNVSEIGEQLAAGQDLSEGLPHTEKLAPEVIEVDPVEDVLDGLGIPLVELDGLEMTRPFSTRSATTSKIGSSPRSTHRLKRILEN